MSVPAFISSSTPCLLLHKVTSSDIQDTNDHRSCRFRLQRLKQTNVGTRLFVIFNDIVVYSTDGEYSYSKVLRYLNISLKKCSSLVH